MEANTNIHNTEVNQPFDYLFILDFEATCDEGAVPIVTIANQEIIEFPILVYDLKFREVIDEIHHYIKPIWVEFIPPFCTKLTGITTEQVANSMKLEQVLESVDNYIHREFTMKSNSFCFLTDGEWDLKTMLCKEATQKNIQLKDHYRSFYNLKRLYTECFGLAAVSLRNMANLLNTPMENHHSGIDDCKTILHILDRILDEGYQLKAPEQIPKDYDPLKDPMFIDFSSYRSVLEPTSCTIEIRGLPYKSTKEDVQTFFGHLKAKEITMLNNEWGKPSGRAEVTFYNHEDAIESMKKHKDYIGTRYVEIFPKNSNVQEDEDEEEEEKIETDTLRLRGIPFAATEQDVITFFGDAQIQPNGVYIVRDSSGRALGGYVKFVSVEDAQKGMLKHKAYMGTRYVELFPSTSEQFRSVKELNQTLS